MALNPLMLSDAVRIVGLAKIPVFLLTTSALISILVGARFGLIFVLGLLLGMTFEGFRFGFA